MTDLAKLVVSLEAQTAQYMREMERANKRADKFQKRFKQSMNGASTALKAFVAGVSVSKFTHFYQSHADGIDQLAKTADALGLATEKLQALYHISELSGVSSTAFNKSLTRMQKSLGEAARKGGTSADALEDLGINLQTIINESPDHQIQVLADAISGMENQTVKASIAADLLGREGNRMLKVLNQISKDGVEPTVQELENLGIAINRVDASKVEQANDQFARVGQVLKGAGNRMAVETAPILGGLSELFLKTARGAAQTSNTTESFSRRAIPAIGFVYDVVNALKIVWLGVRQAVSEVTLKTLDMYTTIASVGGSIAERLGFDASGIKDLKGFRDSFKETVSDFRHELQAAMLKEPPSTEITDFLNNYLNTLEVAAIEASEQRSSSLSSLLLGGSTSVNTSSFNNEDPYGFGVDGEVFVTEAMEREQRLADMVSTIRDQARRREEHEQAKHMAFMERFQQASLVNKVKLATTEFSELIRVATSGSKRLFKISQFAGVSEALISTYQGIAAGVRLGWPMGIPAVAWAIANGFKQVRAIKSQRYGGGSGSVSSPSPTPSAVPSLSQDTASNLNEANNEQTLQRSINVQILGDVYDGDTFTNRVATVLKELDSNSRIRFTDESGRLTVEVT